MERCKACNCKVNEDNMEQNAYGDAFCSVCWNIKERFPMKANDEIANLKPYYQEESRGDIAESHLKMVTLIILALMILAGILSLIKENSNGQFQGKPQDHEEVEQ